jgi:hypothetical protein
MKTRAIKSDGRSSELAARQALVRYVALLNIPRLGARVCRAGLLPTSVACDLCGTIVGTGRAFVCDVKHCLEPDRFTFSKYVKLHQLVELNSQGNAGAVAGLMVEAAHESRKCWFWIDWQHLQGTGINFDDCLNLGPTSYLPKVVHILPIDSAIAEPSTTIKGNP